MNLLSQLKATTVTELEKWCREQAIPFDPTRVYAVVSPYRISPLGAHVDHQGGAVLGRTIDQYSVLTFLVRETSAEIDPKSTLSPDTANFLPTTPVAPSGWQRYAQAAAIVLHQYRPLTKGIIGVVTGSLVGAGLSSSASVILAYLHALAFANGFEIGSADFVELARRVENEQLGLNNGIQDQTAITYGEQATLLHMDVYKRQVIPIADPVGVEDVCFLLAYSGFSRELLGSGFNNRVAECRQAAQLLDPKAEILGQVAPDRRNGQNLLTLPRNLAKRARHFYDEIERVAAGQSAWANGDWVRFGRIMNQSCHSSIYQYESGSQPLVDLQDIAIEIDGVYGSRFSGGGYGGCLIMLVERAKADTISQQVKAAYLKKYPEKAPIAHLFIAETESTVRIETPAHINNSPIHQFTN
ncbi:MAG TPA: hypothetical protein ENJ56_04790 [Anaerolineae bacterium]|nr:hypothetical protein [Anaerolineae bacterium]